jgi:arsenate reductase
MDVIEIWHNPRCSKSRAALALLEARGHKMRIRRYLEEPPSAEELRQAQDALGLRAIDMMRPGEALFTELGLSRDADDTPLIEAMAAHPKLIERPIVLWQGRAAIGRPPERVLDILQGLCTPPETA